MLRAANMCGIAECLTANGSRWVFLVVLWEGFS